MHMHIHTHTHTPWHGKCYLLPSSAKNVHRCISFWKHIIAKCLSNNFCHVNITSPHCTIDKHCFHIHTQFCLTNNINLQIWHVQTHSVCAYTVKTRRGNIQITYMLNRKCISYLSWNISIWSNSLFFYIYIYFFSLQVSLSLSFSLSL